MQTRDTWYSYKVSWQLLLRYRINPFSTDDAWEKKRYNTDVKISNDEWLHDQWWDTIQLYTIKFILRNVFNKGEVFEGNIITQSCTPQHYLESVSNSWVCMRYKDRYAQVSDFTYKFQESLDGWTVFRSARRLSPNLAHSSAVQTVQRVDMHITPCQNLQTYTTQID